MIDFSQQFSKTRGQPFEVNGKTYYLAYTLNVAGYPTLSMEFIQARPPYRQGVHIESDHLLRIAKKEDHAMLLWEDAAPKRVLCDIAGAENVRIWNIWDTGDGTVHSWHNGAAMTVEPIGTASWQFSCNDGHPDDACDDLIFTIRLE